LVVLLNDFNAKECESVSLALRLSGSDKKKLLFRHSKLGKLPSNMDSALRIYAVALGRWCYQHLQIEKLFAQCSDILRSYSEDDVEQRIRRLYELRIDFDIQPLANGEFIMQRTNVPHGPKLGALKAWLFHEQIARDLTTLEEIDTLLCTLAWQSEDTTRWPKLQFP
jgi:hypothetical protein